MISLGVLCELLITELGLFKHDLVLVMCTVVFIKLFMMQKIFYSDDD